MWKRLHNPLFDIGRYGGYHECMTCRWKKDGRCDCCEFHIVDSLWRLCWLIKLLSSDL